jgi:hypothetical protein
MLVAHVAITPLSGSPIRICQALNRYTDISARLVVFKPDWFGGRTFAGDIDYSTEGRPEEARALFDRCDVIHFHHYIDLATNPFGIDFTAYERAGKRVVRQFQSTAMWVSSYSGRTVDDVMLRLRPVFVIPHYPERSFPFGRIVPNFVPQDDPLYQPATEAERDPHGVHIFFSPSWRNAGWSRRWDTKGSEETIRLLHGLSARHPEVVPRVVVDTPHEECLRQRRLGHISIDELFTGSFHLVSLESLAQGLPTLCFLDERTRRQVRELAGTEALPWINCHVSEAAARLTRLIADPDQRAEHGRLSRRWIKQYWTDRRMVEHYRQAYLDLFNDPASFDRPRFPPLSARTAWAVRGRSDAEWFGLRRQAAVTGEPVVGPDIRPTSLADLSPLEQALRAVVLEMGVPEGAVLHLRCGTGRLLAALEQDGCQIDARDFAFDLRMEDLRLAPDRLSIGDPVALTADHPVSTIILQDLCERLSTDELATLAASIRPLHATVVVAIDTTRFRDLVPTRDAAAWVAMWETLGYTCRATRPLGEQFVLRLEASPAPTASQG